MATPLPYSAPDRAIAAEIWVGHKTVSRAGAGVSGDTPEKRNAAPIKRVGVPNGNTYAV